MEDIDALRAQVKDRLELVDEHMLRLLLRMLDIDAAYEREDQQPEEEEW